MGVRHQQARRDDDRAQDEHADNDASVGCGRLKAGGVLAPYARGAIWRRPAGIVPRRWQRRTVAEGVRDVDAPGRDHPVIAACRAATLHGLSR
jgi:hypothetical protein